MVKVSINRFVQLRIATIRREVETETQKIRGKTLKNLEEIFNAATRIARGDVKHQRADGKMVPITLNQRRMWVHVATHAAKTMNSIASSFNEQEINNQLDELENLVNEANTKSRKT